MPDILYRINPDRKRPWNDLPLLPIRKEFYENVEVLSGLGNAKAALARLQGRSVVIPNQGLLINSISLQEAKNSSEIENIFTTNDELYKAYSDDHMEGSGASKEVLRYREALWSGYHNLQSIGRFSLRYFTDVCGQIKKSDEGIRPPFSNTVILQGGSGFNAGNIVYTPPRGKEVISEKMENLIDFINDDDRYRIDPLLKMCIAHYQFEAIHPFRDGNGRTGRIFNINYLTAKGLLDYPILYHSRYILENKNGYYGTLTGISQRGDWKKWFMFMLKAIEVTSNITYHKINQIVSAKDAILEHISNDSRKFQKTEGLIDAIFTQPYTKVRHLTEKGLYAENTAREYLNKLTDMGILEKKRVRGHDYYLNLELANILSE